MSFDQFHVGVIALLFIAGTVWIAATFPKVSPIRRGVYGFALPVWAGIATVYAWRFVEYTSIPIDVVGIIARFLFFSLALMGLLLPYVDRLEARPPKIVLTVEDE